ncbi:MAG: MBL fold metallo-hydrolase [Candidatus Diapherotrites archaeon]|nr:MBL fold metallo-hydrolase [Candidatus Diapherotrites archaeon]
MRIGIYGAGREVGRSAILLESGRSRVLLDYGVKVTEDAPEYPLKFEGLIDGMIVSHAHLDHTGYVPHYFTESETNVFMTPPTHDLSYLLWKDMIKVAKRKEIEPAYNMDAVRLASQYVVRTDYYETTPITSEISYEFYDAGHIPGSALTKLYTKEGTVLYTGDVKVYGTHIQRGADLTGVEADVLIMESTYADKSHPDRKVLEQKFVESVKETLDNGGFVILPVFAVGRAQEIVDILVSHGVENIFFDGMARDATKIILRHPDYITNAKKLKNVMRKVHWIKTQRDRERAIQEPAVLVTTAGMMQGGPVIFYTTALKDDPKSKIIFTGYLVEDTPGRRVLEEGVFEADGYEFKLQMAVERYDFSAHAGRDELFKLVKNVNPQYVVAVHGDEDNTVRLAEDLKEEFGIKTYAPKLGERVDITL